MNAEDHGYFLHNMTSFSGMTAPLSKKKTESPCFGEMVSYDYENVFTRPFICSCILLCRCAVSISRFSSVYGFVRIKN